jgi:hypothetical protein
MKTQNTPTQRKLLFENTTCSRCGGAGRLPYSVYGGVCFKCHGRGATLTKRGRAAQEWLNAQREKPLEDFKPGDLIYSEGVPCIGQRSQWHRVSYVKLLNGAEAGHPNHPDLKCVQVHCHKYMMGGFVGSSKARFGMTGPEKADLRDRALAYQATLNKSGKVAKRATKEAV